MRFDHQTLPQRVRFASGAAAENLREALTDLGARRLMVIASRGQRVTAESILAGAPVAHWCEEVVMHVPVEVARRACDAAADHHIDTLVSIGGGSATGLAKAVALTSSQRADEAIGVLDDLVERFPTRVDPRVQRAIARAVVGDVTGARSDLRAAKALDPDDPAVRRLQSALADVG